MIPLSELTAPTLPGEASPATLDQLLNAIPGYVFLVDREVRILRNNAAAAGLLGAESRGELRRRGGELLHCVHATVVGGRCGTGEFCRDCLLRSAVAQAFASRQPVRRRLQLEFVLGAEHRRLDALLSASALTLEGERVVLLILEDVAEVLHLNQAVCVCARCKRVRDGRHGWDEVDQYLKRQMDVALTRSFCPDCAAHEQDLFQIRDRLARLTPREREVFSLVIRGNLNKEIAANLGVAEKTVKIHRSRVMAKMQAGSVAELVHLAERLDLLAPDQEALLLA